MCAADTHAETQAGECDIGLLTEVDLSQTCYRRAIRMDGLVAYTRAVPLPMPLPVPKSEFAEKRPEIRLKWIATRTDWVTDTEST